MKHTIVTFALFLVACGAATQSHVLETRSDAPEYLEAIHRAAVARGLTAQYAEERQVAIVLDRETRTRINFQARRNGVVLGVSTAGGEDVPPDVQQAELVRGEELGRQIYAEAAAQWNQILQEREIEAAREAEEERLAAERRAARRAERRQQMEDNAELRAFMEQTENARVRSVRAMNPRRTMLPQIPPATTHQVATTGVRPTRDAASTAVTTCAPMQRLWISAPVALRAAWHVRE